MLPWYVPCIALMCSQIEFIWDVSGRKLGISFPTRIPFLVDRCLLSDVKRCLSLSYGVISPPKFNLLFATLLLWINARFYNPTSIIQHCAFTNQHPYFKFSVLRLHVTFVCVCAICLHRNPTFLFSVFTHQHPYFKFTFRSFKCDIHAFIAMLMFGVCVAVQSTICLQHNAIFLLDIELHAWVSWPSDGTPLYKTCGLKIVARTRLQRPHFVALQSSCKRWQIEVGCIFVFFSTVHFVGTLSFCVRVHFIRQV